MIAAYKGTSFRSRLTRFVSWSDYSHISWVDVDGWEIEAWSSGVRKLDVAHSDHTPGTVVEIYDLDLTQVELCVIRSFLHDQIGKDYDHMGNVHFLTRRPEYKSGQDKWFCSELIFAAFLRICRPLLARIKAYKVYPGMIVYSPLLHYVETRTVQPPPADRIAVRRMEEICVH